MRSNFFFTQNRLIIDLFTFSLNIISSTNLRKIRTRIWNVLLPYWIWTPSPGKTGGSKVFDTPGLIVSYVNDICSFKAFVTN